MNIIKAKEIRIGNWFKVLGNNKQVIGLSKYNYRTNTETVMHYAEFKDAIPLKLFHLKPILISEDWLLNFNFQPLTKNFDTFLCKMYTIDNFSVNYTVFKDDRNNFFSLGGVFNYNCEIKYVHELQNLYYFIMK